MDIAFDTYGLNNTDTLQSNNKYVTALMYLYQISDSISPLINVNSVTDYDYDFNTTMIGTALMSEGKNITQLHGRDSDLYRDTLIAISFEPSKLTDTLTSGKLDTFVDGVENNLVSSCEQYGLNTTTHGLNTTTQPQGTVAYNDFCVNAVLYVVYNTTTAQLGGKDSTDYVVKLVDIGLEGAYQVNSTQLYVISMFDVLSLFSTLFRLYLYTHS